MPWFAQFPSEFCTAPSTSSRPAPCWKWLYASEPLLSEGWLGRCHEPALDLVRGKKRVVLEEESDGAGDHTRGLRSSRHVEVVVAELPIRVGTSPAGYPDRSGLGRGLPEPRSPGLTNPSWVGPALEKEVKKSSVVVAVTASDIAPTVIT